MKKIKQKTYFTSHNFAFQAAASVVLPQLTVKQTNQALAHNHEPLKYLPDVLWRKTTKSQE